jgi:uncharacterized protein (TIGR03437 family)
VGSVPLTTRGGQQVADLYFPAYQVGGVGAGIIISGEYSGDAAFSSGGATKTITITTPTAAAAIIPSAPLTVWPQPADAQGLSWQATITLQEVAGVPAIITGFTIDGQTQNLSQYFPSQDIPARGTLNAVVIFRNLDAPVTRTFGFAGIDGLGNFWTRQLSINFTSLPIYDYFNLAATPLIVAQDPAADPSCQWAVQLNVDDQGGFGVNQLTALDVGGLVLTSQIPSIFGTTRLDAYGGLQGTLCFGGITPPASDTIEVDRSDGVKQTLTVSFAPPAATSAKLSVSPATINLTNPDILNLQPVTSANLTVNLSDKTQSWTASIFPMNRTTSWLSASQLTGTGTTQITLTASGAGFERGVYRAAIVFQSANTMPQYVNVPVMFTWGGSSNTSITTAVNAASFTTGISPGMLLSVFGSNLANSTQTYSANPAPYSLGGVSATVNDLAAPLLYVSPNQVNIQVPYEVGAGPAVLGINNNGQIAGYAIQVAPSAPGIFTGTNGEVLCALGGFCNIIGYMPFLITGAGDTSPFIATGSSPPAPTSGSTSTVPILPLSVTVGGVPAFVISSVIEPGLIGITEIAISLPENLPPGRQPVVVTVNGVSSAPAYLLFGGSASTPTLSNK